MDWERELEAIIRSSSLKPSFEQWLEATGYSDYARNISTCNINVQATAMRSLYDYYETEMRKRLR
ncbi:MAG: hypothetical protein JO302_03100 [Candidatus Eremiobacteraeota bacterium]|nr:hypothetical protein [Candidatus Eremiobacteraeota bacterium]